MRDRIAAARQLGVRGLFSRFIWRLRQVLRVLAFQLWRSRQGEKFASAASPGLQRSPIRSYLPCFEDVRACYDRAAGVQAAGDSRERILAAAARICSNSISVRGTGELAFKYELGNWYNYERGAAIMLNRHDFLLPLVQAHVLAGDARSGDKVRDLFEYWIENFDLSRLRRCDTPIDAAIRLLNWAWVFNSDILRPEPRQSGKLLSIIWQQLEYIYAWHSAGGNHLVLEALAAYVYGELELFPERPVRRWTSWGRTTLLKELFRQTTDDGVHTEQSMFYHQAVTTHYLKFFLAADARQDRFDGQYRQRFSLMLDYIHDTAKPSLGHPVLGDGEALVTDDREHWEARALLAARFALFDRPVSATLVPMIDDSSAWLLARWPWEIDTTPEAPESRVMAASGLAVLRGAGTYVLMDAAPFSDPEFPHHGHADALSMEVCAGEDDLFVDPGGYGYYDDAFRRYFRSTTAHNTISVGDRNQSALFGVLGYGRLCNTTLVRYELEHDYACVVASHDGYDPAIHQRSLFLVRQPHQCLVIADWLGNVEGQNVTSRLHAAPDCRVDLEAMQLRAGRTHRAFGIAFDASAPVAHRIRYGEQDDAIQGWVSPETHQVEPADTWEAALEQVFDCTLVTLIALEPDIIVDVNVSSQDHADLAIGPARYLLRRAASGFVLEHG